MSFYYVKAYHGPSTSFHTRIHKPHHLKGLKNILQSLGYRVDLVPVDYNNYCMLQICGHQIFRCNIQNLHFNTVAYRDTVCKRAVEAVLDATKKLLNARNFLYFYDLIETQLFLRGKYCFKEIFLTEEQHKEFADINDNMDGDILTPEEKENQIKCTECLKCCKLDYSERQDYERHRLETVNINMLQTLGYRVDLVPVECPNYCMLQMCGYQVFRCNIQNLHFNTATFLDTVCQRAVDAVLDATVRLKNARNYIYFKTMVEREMFLRSKYSYKDTFIKPEQEYKQYADVLDCAECCQLTLALKPKVVKERGHWIKV